VAATAFAIVGLVLLLVASLLKDAWPAMAQFGLSFITSHSWNPVTKVFGVLPAIYGTVATSLVAMLIAVPVGVGAGIFLAEFSPGWLERPLTLLIELLAAIPSVVIGLWGLFVLVPVIRPLEDWLGKYLGSVPFFKGPPIGIGILTASLILAVMVLPLLTSIVREVIRAVPTTQHEAAYALGVTEWEAIWSVVLPYGRSGITGAIILALGRALGETLAVTMVIGNVFKIDVSLFAQATTLASLIASQFREADSDLYLSALIYAGLVLFVITLIVNIVARLLVHRMTAATIGIGQGAG
jgi:phosphate transport system permease protein